MECARGGERISAAGLFRSVRKQTEKRHPPHQAAHRARVRPETGDLFGERAELVALAQGNDSVDAGAAPVDVGAVEDL